MAQQQYQYQNPQFDRSEMFALGAAAGAVITAAITEYLERRRPKTAWEKAQARSAEALGSLNQVATVSKKRARQYRKSASKQAQRAQKQAIGLKEAATAAIGISAATSVLDKVRDYAGSATERVVGDPYAVSGSIKETLKEQYDALRGSSNGNYSEKVQEIGGTVLETLKGVATTASDTAKDYAATARETIKDAEISDKARDYTGVVAGTLKDYATSARETLKDAKLSEKAKDYGAVVTDTVVDYATSARETLKDAKFGEKAKDYATVAGATVATYSAGATKATAKVAKDSASKLTENAAYLAEATSEQADELRRGVRKSVKRTRRRTRWGLRAFVIGLIIGLVTAPQSGQNTRDALTAFVEDLLDVFMPEEAQR